MSSETSEITSEFATAAYHDLNLHETELTLGLPGESRGRKLLKKRRFSDTIELKSSSDENSDANHSDATKPPPDEEQVAGWPPVTCYRKNVVNGSFKFVKVAVDGAPYLRKVDLESFAGYYQLQRALADVFAYFTVGDDLSDNLGFQNHHNTSFSTEIKNVLNEKRLNRKKYVSTYEDKDGDWMLVGDVPWKMFVQTCKRIRLMRSLEAINAAPRTSSKCSVSSC